jgi:hypothetical protein
VALAAMLPNRQQSAEEACDSDGEHRAYDQSEKPRDCPLAFVAESWIQRCGLQFLGDGDDALPIRRLCRALGGRSGKNTATSATATAKR